MEHKFYTDNFERLLKEQADEFRMYPSKRVWHSIYNDLHPDRKWPSIAVSLVLVTVLFLIGYWNNNSGPDGGMHKTVTAGVNAANGNTSPETAILNNNNSPEYLAALKSGQHILPENNSGNKNIGQDVTAVPRHNASGTTAAPQAVYYPQPENQAGTRENNNTGIRTETGVQPVSEKALQGNSAAVIHLNSEMLVKSTVTGNASLSAAAGSIPATTQNNEAVPAETEDEDAAPLLNATISPLANSSAAEESVKTGITTGNTIKTTSAVKKTLSAAKQLSAEDKSWIEHYALYNKSSHKKWKGRLSSEVYLTPGAGFRKMASNTDYASAAPSVLAVSPAQPNTTISYKPGVTFEAGAGMSYSIAKSIHIKAGIQANFTNYSMGVTDINHPVLTTMMLNNLNTGNPYLESRVSSLANVPGLNKKKLHNQTSQVSIPVGVAVKLAGNQKIEWYAAAAVQPTYVFAGKAYLVSSDHNNYIADASMIRKWNVNTAAETYIHYKMNGFTLQAGPQFRYQLMSTYSPKYTYDENLYNIGLKVGIVKNF